MSTKDQLLYSALDGTAMRCAAERRNLDVWLVKRADQGRRQS
jgi:hypothetical protein